MCKGERREIGRGESLRRESWQEGLNGEFGSKY